MSNLTELKDHLNREIWGVDPESLPFWRAKLTWFLRSIYVITRDLLDGQLTLQAMSLVYATLLSLVPLLALSFSVLKGLGVHKDRLEPMLLSVLEPLGDQGVQINAHIMAFVDNVNVGVLGGLGLGLLLYTVVSLIQKIERAFNYAWRVTRPRPFVQRFRDYVSVIVIGSILAFAALIATASVMSWTVVQQMREIEAVGTLIDESAKLVPYLLIIAAFTFVYIFVPNTKVRLRSALVGAVVAGILWQSVGWVFAIFVAASTRYAAIYSSLAILIMFMIWLYLGWLIMLTGASIAFYHQNPEYLTTRRRRLQLSIRLKERLALLIMYLIGRSYYRGEPAWTADALAEHLSVPMEAIDAILSAMDESKVLVRTDDEICRHVPARDLESIALKQLLAAVRSADEDPYLNLHELKDEPAVDRLAQDIDEGVAGVLGSRTLRDLIRETDPAPGPVRLESETGLSPVVSRIPDG